MKTQLLFNDGRTIGIRHHKLDREPVCCGEGQQTVVLASVGITYEDDNVGTEIEKAQQAHLAGAQIITDHSVTGNIADFHRLLIDNTDTPISYLTVYELLERLNGDKIDKNFALDLLEEQAQRGLTLITVHVTATNRLLEQASQEQTRKIVSTSRGGAALLSILKKTNSENVYLENYDEVLKIFKKYNITLSLGSTFRPASVVDAGSNDILYWRETELMGKLAKQAVENDVPVMIEGIGHAPIHCIPDIIKRSKSLCHNVPYRVLTVSTDIALGYDHIAGAIAIAVSTLNGADLATCITRAEHIGKPTPADIVEGVVAAKIAAHSADIYKLGSLGKDFGMSEARSKLGCHGLVESAIYPEGARQALARYKINLQDGITCSMCGKRCALNNQLDLI